MLEKIKAEELAIIETLHQPQPCAEILFNDFDNLGSFSEDTYGKIRKYQIPFQSYDSMFYEDKDKSKKENFMIKKGLADCYALGGRMTGKSLINLIIDSLCAIIAKTFNWAVISSSDLNHVRGIMEKIVIALRNHPVLKLFNPSIVRSPAYSIHLENGCLLESVNNNLASKNPGGNWFGKHIDKNWEEESSFLTDAITSKKLMAESELGCIFRYSGMTTFPKNSPMGRAFYDLQNKNKIINLPSYVNPYYDKKRDDDAIQEFGGKNSQGYQVQIIGKIVEHGDSVFDMDRIRETYKVDKKGNPITIKHFEISKDNFFNYKDIIILDRPKNAEKAIVALDKGEGAAPTEIIILFLINGIYHYNYNVTNFKLKTDEDEEIVNYIIEKLQANVIAIDVTSGTGKTLFTGLSKKYPENIIGVAFNEKIDVGFDKDDKGNTKYDSKGKPIYRKEFIVDWSIQQLKDIFYNKKIKCLQDFKLDTQFNGVIVMQKSGIRTVYGYKTANHLFQAFQVFGVAHWLTEFKLINPIQKEKTRIGSFWEYLKRKGVNMNGQGLGNGLFQAFIDWMYSSGDISVPSDYHMRCNCIGDMLDNDMSGAVNSLLDYAVNSASEAKFRVECNENTLQKLLNLWLERINLDIKGIPTGLQSLSKEYYKERWQGSSFCVLRIKGWEKISVDNVTIEVPTIGWYVNGSSIYVKRPDSKNYKLGSDEYYLDAAHKIKIPEGKNEEIIVQKPFNRWFDQYPTPYLIRKGVYKNYLGIKTLQEKSDEVISKILPYLFIIKKGTENMFLQGDTDYSDKELKTLLEGFKEELQKYKNKKGQTPTTAVPFDQDYSHLIPDLRNILTEELYRQGNRSILAGLGFIDVIQGITSTRKESVLNPKPFISEVNEGVDGFKEMLLDVIYKIIDRNKNTHRKLFSESKKIIIVNTPLRINIEQILDSIRSGYDRGVISIESYMETLGFDFETEKDRRERELNKGFEDLFYPHLIQNQEQDGNERTIPGKPRKEIDEKNEKENKKPGTPEVNDFKNSDTNYEIAPYKDNSELPKYIRKMPEHAQTIFRTTFNEVMEKTGDESKAFPIATNSAKRWLKKNGYSFDKENQQWVKKGDK